jgi:M6 family metalloprotease-like protein
MMAWVFLAWLAQAPPLEAEKARIGARPPLTEEQKKEYSLPDSPRLKPRAGYVLAVVPLDFPDRPSERKGLEKLFFERVAGYYARASAGQFALRGKVYAPVTLEVERAKFAERDLGRALASFLAREGKEALVTFDGVAFVAAGPMGARGTALWPRKVTIHSVDCILVPGEEGERAVAVIAHEFMHLLGFADKYDDEKVAVGDGCILGTGYSVKEPPPPCADCRERLGWTSPVPIDPTRHTAVVLGPDLKRSVKIALNLDGSEALLLELQDRLVVWHAGGGQKLERVGRYPSATSDRLTPFSDPPFRGRAVGARNVWITDIRIENGKAWFRVGPDAPLTALEEWRKSGVGKRLGD